MMKLKYSICCGLDVHKNVIVATIVTTNKDGYPNICKNLFNHQLRYSKVSQPPTRIIAIMFVKESTGKY